MKLRSLELENFLSHGHTKIDLDGCGLVLIRGIVEGDPSANSNGAGKSALLPDALVWVLFGQTLRGLRGQDVVHNQVKKNCLVTLALDTDDGRSVRIKRAQKNLQYPKSCVEIDHADSPAEVIWGTDEVDKFVEEQLGLKMDTMVPTTIYGKGDSKFFTQLGDAARKEILEDLLGLADISRFETAAKKMTEKVVGTIKQLESDTDVMLARGQELQSKHDGLTQMARDFETTKEGNLASISKSIQKIKEEAVRLQGVMQQLTTGKEALEKQAEDIVHQSEDITPKLAKFEECYQAQRTVETQLKILAQERVNRLKKFTDGLVGKQECPTCLQVITQDHFDACAAPLKTAATEAALAYDEAAKVVAATGSEKKTLEDARNALNKRLHPIATQVEDYERGIVKTESDARMLLGRLQDTVKSQEDETRSVNVAAYHVADAEKELRENRHNLTSIAKAMAEAQDEQPYIHFWVEAFSNRGIKSMLIDRSIPFLNQRAQFYANLLTGGAITVTFSTQTTLKGGDLRDKFDVSVESAVGGDSYRGCSDGQRRRGDIICNLALGDLAAARVKSPLNIAMLDEVADGLDASGIGMVMPLLAQLVKERSSVFVISHNEEVAAYFPKVITVVNKGGFSALEGTHAETQKQAPEKRKSKSTRKANRGKGAHDTEVAQEGVDGASHCS